ncbi:MAG: hypothetical protein DLM64_03125 [Solirubrobacterales bacterium]|nr:MAG: hypothetical protein DLM64_03125 [Solirubrobacterales bacterium]
MAERASGGRRSRRPGSQGSSFRRRLCDVTIRGCRVDLASFGFSRLLRVTFDDCLLAQTDFLEAQLESVRFHHCDLTCADFRGARLKLCELRGCDLSGLQGVRSLRGARAGVARHRRDGWGLGGGAGNRGPRHGRRLMLGHRRGYRGHAHGKAPAPRAVPRLGAPETSG